MPRRSRQDCPRVAFCCDDGPGEDPIRRNDAHSELVLAQRRLELIQRDLESAKAEMVQVLEHSVETAQLELEFAQSKWFNAKGIAAAEASLEQKKIMLKRVQKVLLRTGMYQKPATGSKVEIARNMFTQQVCPDLIGQLCSVAEANDADQLYLVQGCEFWLRRLDFEVKAVARRILMEDDGLSDSSSDASSDSDSSDDEAVYDAIGNALLGCWTLDHCSENMADILVDAGVDWITQRTAKSFSYGAGLVSHDLQQSGKRLTILMKGGLKTLKMNIDMSKSEPSETQAEDGNDVLVTGKWDGKSLTIAGTVKKTGKPLQVSRYYVDGSDLIQEITPVSSQYQPAKRVFRRR
jgi:hypothetical protein